MGFDVNAFRINRIDGKFWEADLMAILHYCQDYFPDVKPSIEAIDFVGSIEEGSPACVRPHMNRIEVDERFRHLPKLCCFLVLHELINNKLFKKYGEVKSDTGPEFQSEIERLQEEGAYFGLL